jgi:hypothetical protein
MTRILVPNGIMIHIAPSRGHEHPAPQDCWRFYRDGMVALAKWAGLSCLEAETDWLQADIDFVMARRSPKSKAPPMTSRDPAGKWGDTIGVFRKQADARPEIALHYMQQLSRKWAEVRQPLRRTSPPAW